MVDSHTVFYPPNVFFSSFNQSLSMVPKAFTQACSFVLCVTGSADQPAISTASPRTVASPKSSVSASGRERTGGETRDLSALDAESNPGQTTIAFALLLLKINILHH
jgi:hypothetical protein